MIIKIPDENKDKSVNNNITDDIYKHNDNPVIKDNIIDQMKEYLKIDGSTARDIYDFCKNDQGIENIQNLLNVPAEEAEEIYEIVSNYIKNNVCKLRVFLKKDTNNAIKIAKPEEPKRRIKLAAKLDQKYVEWIREEAHKFKIRISTVKSIWDRCEQQLRESGYDEDDFYEALMDKVHYEIIKTYTASGKNDKEKKPKKAEQIWAVADEVAQKSNIISMTESRKLFKYVDGVYVSENVEEEVKALAAAEGFEKYETNFLDNDIKNVLYRIHYQKRTPQAEFNKNENIIVVKNGLLDIETGELRPHTPSEIYTNKFNFDYDPNATLSEVFKNYLETTFKDVEYQIDIIQEFFGYCLATHYKLAVFLLLLGEGGNGKGVMLNVLTEFVGRINASGLSLQDICSNDKFTLADMFGKKINVCGDISKAKIPNTDNLKKMTGRDLVRAQFKYGQPFHFKNTAKIINAANEMPKISDETQGFFDRMIIIDFPNRFRNTENDNNDLEAECTTPEALSSILTWAIQGYHRLMKQGNFSHMKNNKEKMDQYTKKVSPIEYYIDEYIYEDEGNFVLADVLFKHYNMFAKKNDLHQSEFQKTFVKNFIETCEEVMLKTRYDRKWIPAQKKKLYGFYNIAIIPTEQEPEHKKYDQPLYNYMDVDPILLPESRKKLNLRLHDDDMAVQA